MRKFDSTFARIIGLPAWSVRRGYGTFLTMEFGQPSLVIREPMNSSQPSDKLAREREVRRLVSVQGQWHLWLYCSTWRVFDQVRGLIGDSSSRLSIDMAAKYLDGQALQRAQLVRRPFKTVLEFDLGASLEIVPYSRQDELWMLYEPEGSVLTVRADRKYSYELGSSKPRETRWTDIWR